ncbi:MAG TPA: hypothetical protein VHE30_27475 [Polyangiaceae bacterium]|nr:hypothetical protein [Polyangiaceae bacterium]
MQTFAAHVEALPRADRDAIRAVIPEETWTEIERAGLLGWLPLEVNLRCTRAVAAQLGKERTHVFFRKLLFDTSNTPLLRGLVQSVLRVAVRDPGLYLPWISKGFELMFRDAGRWTVTDRGIGTAKMEVTGVPAECLTDLVWPESVASALCALLDLIQYEGSCVVDHVDPESFTVVFRSTWRGP